MPIVPGSSVPANHAHRPLLAGALAAIGASLCCVGPFVLLTLGVGGAWVASLTALEPLRPFLIAATLAFLALAYRRLYVTARVCTPGTPCAQPRHLQRQRQVFWLVAVALAVLLAAPLAAPLFY